MRTKSTIVEGGLLYRVYPVFLGYIILPVRGTPFKIWIKIPNDFMRVFFSLSLYIVHISWKVNVLLHTNMVNVINSEQPKLWSRRLFILLSNLCFKYLSTHICNLTTWTLINSKNEPFLKQFSWPRIRCYIEETIICIIVSKMSVIVKKWWILQNDS